MSRLAARLAKLENLTVARRYPGVLRVPPRIRTDEDRADFAVRFKAQQLRLIGMGQAVRQTKEIGNG